LKNSKEHFGPWLEAEQNLTRRFNPEDSRTSGLIATRDRRWKAALLRLEEAARFGLYDFQLLDALGEAAYRAHMPEALVPYENKYKHPFIATHMARAWMLLGEIDKAQEFLQFANDSLLKKAINALLGIEGSIENTIASMLPFAETDPKLDYPDFWRALAPIANAAGRKDLVKLAERRCKELSHENPVVHYNQALGFLNDGEIRAGWISHDWRLVPGSQCAPETSLNEIAMWEGEKLRGKSIAVIFSDGFGDNIFCLRYLFSFIEEGATVSVVAPLELIPLIETSFPQVKVYNSKDSKKVETDYWCYAFSIPTRAAIWKPVQTQGYLKADLKLVEKYRENIKRENPSNLPIYGLVWHGDIRTPAMRTRSYSVEEFLEHSEIYKRPCFVISLQKDATPEELLYLERKIEGARGKFLDVSSSLQDFSQTAAWMMILDHIYSCDTSTGHLAGALGVPSTVLIRNTSIWQWRASNEDKAKALWYDSVKIKYAFVPKYSYMFEMREV